MLIIARTTGAQTIVMNMVTGTGKQKGVESLSENREWRRRFDAERQVVPDGGTRNRNKN